ITGVAGGVDRPSAGGATPPVSCEEAAPARGAAIRTRTAQATVAATNLCIRARKRLARALGHGRRRLDPDELVASAYRAVAGEPGEPLRAARVRPAASAGAAAFAKRGWCGS